MWTAIMNAIGLMVQVGAEIYEHSQQDAEGAKVALDTVTSTLGTVRASLAASKRGARAKIDAEIATFPPRPVASDGAPVLPSEAALRPVPPSPVPLAVPPPPVSDEG